LLYIILFVYIFIKKKTSTPTWCLIMNCVLPSPARQDTEESMQTQAEIQGQI